MDPEAVSMVQLVKEAIGVVSVCGRVHEGKRENLKVLRRRYYYATWKADGTRYMMVWFASVKRQKQERRYLIYDMMALNSISLIEHPFYERFKMVEEEVIEPRNLEKRLNTHYNYDLEPFRVRRKNFWLLSTFDKVLKNFIRDLSHEADGLIYQFQKPLPKPKKNVSYAKEIFSTHQKAVTSNQPIR
ncbi:hypothetical protein ACFE04_030858 [Oxalis oulophora]